MEEEIQKLLKEGYKLLDEAGAARNATPAIALCVQALEIFKKARELATQVSDDALTTSVRAAIADAFSQRGHQQRYSKNFKESIADLSQALRFNPDIADDFYYRGLSYQQIEDQKAARNDFTQYLRYGKNDYLRADTEIILAKLVTKGDDKAQVLNLGTEGSRLNSEAANLMQPRGDAAPNPARAAAVYNKALEIFNKALELTPNDFLARTGKLAALAEQAECYAAIQEYDLAIQNLSEAIQMKPNPRHLFRRGELYRQAGQRELARADLTEYLRKGEDAELKEQAQKYLNNLTPKAESAT